MRAGTVVLGLERAQGDEVGWDNEFGAHEVAVNEFAIENYNVTNHDFLRFMQARGYHNHALCTTEGRVREAKEGNEPPRLWLHQRNPPKLRTLAAKLL